MASCKTEKEKADLKKRARAMTKSVRLSPMSITEPGRSGRRWALRFEGEELRQYVHDHRVSIILAKSGNVCRLVNLTPNDKSHDGFVKLGCPLDVGDIEQALLMVTRCINDILDCRTMKSLASIKQLERIRGLVAVCEKRKDNLISLPDDLIHLNGGAAGRFIDETKAILVRSGLWDLDKNVEIVKPKKSKKAKLK